MHGMRGRLIERELLAQPLALRHQRMGRAPRLLLYVNSQVVLGGLANGIGRASGKRGSRKACKRVYHSKLCSVLPVQMMIS